MTSTRAIETLLAILHDPEVGTRQRIEACEGLLAYEAPPEAVIEARDYLVRVFEDNEGQTLPDRMDALKLARKFESPKIALPTIHTKKQEADRREAWRAYEIAERELKIILATKDTPPPGWDDDLRADSYVPPAEGWPGPPPEIPLKDLAVARRTRQVRMEREMAAAIERDLKAAEAQSRKRSRYNGNANGNGSRRLIENKPT
jgi:hypothetical protein